MLVTLDAIETHTPSIKTFWFRTERIPQYIAGQFIELTLPQVTGGERNKRWFTLSSAPTENRLGITTKIDPKNTSTYKQTLWRLRPGDNAIMSEPMGDFVLPMQAKTPILYVVGGMGVTPIRSMIKWLTDIGQKRDITLLHASHSPEDFIFGDVFMPYNVKPQYIVSNPAPGWKGATGRIDAELILRNHQTGGLIYIAGPEPMTEHLVRDLRQKGIPAAKLVTDYFPGYPML